MNNIRPQKIYMQEQIKSITEKNFIHITNDIEELVNFIYKEKQEVLLQIIMERRLNKNKIADTLDGFIFQKLIQTNMSTIKLELNKYFPNGVTTLKSSLKLNYQPLQELLINQQFQEADKITNEYLCELVAIQTKNEKKWLYFTDIQFLPVEDLFTLDLLWKIYSKGKFGFSIQKDIWMKSNKKWDKLWEKISWTNNGKMKRYPEEFEWTLTAPKGHLPLSNQLRGTKTLLYLFNHIE